MSVSISVQLLSGQGATVLLPTDASVTALQDAVQKSLGTRISNLVTQSGKILQASESLLQAGIGDWDCLTAVVRESALASNFFAFALIRPDGSVITWGEKDYGGDSSAVKDELQNVDAIQATATALAALRSDGTVVTWGAEEYGGDSSGVREQLKHVRHIQSTHSAFAALRADGTVISWGEPGRGGDCSQVQGQLQDVTHIQAAFGTFAALRSDGRVIAWGEHAPPAEIRAELTDIIGIQRCGEHGFAAIKPGGRFVHWLFDSIFPSSVVQTSLNDIQHLCAVGSEWVAVDGAGTAEWKLFGHAQRVSNVEAVQHTYDCHFAALLKDGTVVHWGPYGYIAAGDLHEQLKNVVSIQTSDDSFAALRSDGSVRTWRYNSRRVLRDGAASDVPKRVANVVPDQLRSVKEIQANTFAFAAIREDGSVVTWGHKSYGGDSSAVQSQLRNVRRIQGTDTAFAALRSDGSVVTWGSRRTGGASRHISRDLGRTGADDAAEDRARVEAEAKVQAKAKAKVKAKAEATAKAKAKTKNRAVPPAKERVRKRPAARP
mmetsp:Transcript_43999/g.98544  ORF Transcript_43999/g.98544 Transcript_43999/m.98544 type:complete len:546 (+) Transcript_43999:31-1668(+)